MERDPLVVSGLVKGGRDPNPPGGKVDPRPAGVRLWVERVGPVWGQPGPIDLVSPDGAYLGTIDADRTRLPAAFGPGGLAAFIELDALDVPTVVVRRITLPRS